MEYNIVKYADIGKVKSGKRLPKGEVVSELISNNKYIRVRDITGNMLNSKDVQYITDEASKKIKKYRVQARDIIISVVGTVGSIAEIPHELNGAYLTENCDNLLVDERICLKKYLKHYLISQYGQEQVIANTVGSTQPKLPIYGIENFDIVLPDINIQNKIVKILDAFDNKILINNQINDNLYNLAVAIYNDSFKSNNQGNCSIGDYIIPKRGKNLLSRDAVLGDIPVVAGGLEPATYHNVANTKAPVITISASGANAGYINLWNIPVWSSDSSYIDSSITENVYYWYVTLKTRQEEIFDAQTGSAQPHIYPQHIVELPMCKVEDEDILKYEKQVEPLFKMIGKNKIENRNLEQLRDTLLPKLMNGEIDLENIHI